jgi:ribosomal protein S27E
MSTFMRGDTACPGCGHTFECEVVVGLNGTRRTDLVEAIMNGTFQRVTCPACGHEHEVESTFEFVDVERGVFVVAHPSSLEPGWRQLESETAELTTRRLSERAEPPARALGQGLFIRTVFGHDALREKLLCHREGFDDRKLECFKLSVILSSDLALTAAGRPRLVATNSSELVFDHALPAGVEDSVEVGMRVPRVLFDDFEPSGFGDVARQLELGSYVDLGRVLGPRPADAKGARP